MSKNFRAAISAHMHEGCCPGAGSLGECPAIWLESSSATMGQYGAAVYLWKAAASLPYAEVARWFQEVSGCDPDDVIVYATMHDPWNQTSEGACSDGARPLHVSFSVPLAKAEELGLPAVDEHTRRLSPARELQAVRHERVERLLFEIRQAFLDYGRAAKAESPDAIRETSSRGVGLLDQLAGLARWVGRDGLSTAAVDVLAERRRQIEVEGYTTAHDDQHLPDDLADAGACYALTSSPIAPPNWPWEAEAWKPKGRRRNLVRAAALCLAAIELHDRLTAFGATGDQVEEQGAPA